MLGIETLKTYRRLRKEGMTAGHAFHAARTKRQFDRLEYLGLVELEWLPDNSIYDDSYIDTWPVRERQKARKELYESIRRDGIWGLVGRYHLNGRSEQAGSVWGFVGQDASWYEFDIMSETISALRKAINKRCRTCHGSGIKGE